MRQRMSSEQRKIEEDKNRVRIRIANLVRRKPEIESNCCICGKKGVILHSKNDNPYLITFLCWNCRKDKENFKIAEQYRVDIRTILNKTSLHVNSLTEQQVTDIIVRYMNTDIKLEDFCSEEGISPYQFDKVISRYDELYPNQKIKQLIKNKTSKSK